MATLTGKTLGGFLIQEELGRGAMGVVFKARQISMDRLVALKFLPKSLAQDEKVVQRFLREARAAGQLSHPNVVGVYDAGIMDGFHFIAMEFVDGNSVYKKMAQNGPYNEKDTLEIAGQIAAALKYAHGRGILHRDIKPDNFLIDSSGRVRLADLGLAKIEKTDAREGELTQDGSAMGTPYYMSPEQCMGHAVDFRSDLYSLGASMYVMATGKPPFEAPTAAAVMVKVLTEAPRPIKSLNPNLSPGFVAITEKLMAKEAAKRFANAQQVMEAIERCKHGSYKPSTHPHPRVHGAPAPAAQSPVRNLIIGAGAALLVLVVLAVLMHGGNKQNSGAMAQGNLPPVKPPDPIPAPDPKKTDPPPTDPSKVESGNPLKAPEYTDTDNEMHSQPGQRFRQLREELSALSKHDPDTAVKRWNEFMADKSIHDRLRDRARIERAKAYEVIAQIEKEWKAARATARDLKAENRYGEAFWAYHEFSEKHPLSPEAALAHTAMTEMLENWCIWAREQTADGQGEMALQKLNGAIQHLPAAYTERLKTEAAAIETEVKKAREKADTEKRLAEAENKHLQALYDTACAQARKPEYKFADAAKTWRDGLTTLKALSSRTDAQSMADIYSAADKCLNRMRNEFKARAPVDMPTGIFHFKTALQITAWTADNFTFSAKGLPPQLVPWSSVNGSDLIQLEEALHKGATSPALQFELGALAYAVAEEKTGLENIKAAAAGDAKYQPMLSAALRFAKDPGSFTAGAGTATGTGTRPAADREAAARQVFEDAKSARIRKDKDAAQKLMTQLPVDYADTEFFKQHDKEIADFFNNWGDKPVPEKKDPVAELKALGWSDVTGNWTIDSRGKNAFVTTGGTLFSPGLDGEIKVKFQLQEGATIRVFVRYNADSKLTRKEEKIFAAVGVEFDNGYGVYVHGATEKFFGDMSDAAAGKGYKAEIQRAGVPLKVKQFSPSGAAVHEVQVSVQSNKLDIDMDGVSFHSNGKLWPAPTLAIIVEGGATLLSPTVQK